jgi:hypothetical protein
MERASTRNKTFALHGWIGLALVAVFWTINWTASGARTQWAFFPLWLGYCLTIDALVVWRTGTSLLSRDWRKYIGLFLVSAPVWWLFEAINWRLQNWTYDGAELFSPLTFFLFATINFTTVIPAVFGAAELVSSFDWVKRLGRGLVIRPTRPTTLTFFLAGWGMLALMLAWPKVFFPFSWISIFFILEPINIWMGNRSLASWLERGDWRPVVSLWVGVLLTAVFWEMWNYFSYPKWIYQVPWGDCCHIFEMPLLGYGGYLPFALELFAVYHLLVGLFGEKDSQYVHLLEE